MANYVYKRTEPGLWTVGFYAPDDEWVTDSDHGSSQEAAERVAWLNGSPAERFEDRPDLVALIAMTRKEMANAVGDAVGRCCTNCAKIAYGMAREAVVAS